MPLWSIAAGRRVTLISKCHGLVCVEVAFCPAETAPQPRHPAVSSMAPSAAPAALGVYLSVLANIAVGFRGLSQKKEPQVFLLGAQLPRPL
jgi:hypothetical protein